MAVTIKDVAAKAGVSPSTVSRVCNDNPSISKQTRDRVKRIMAQLGYESAAAPGAPAKTIPAVVAVVLPPAPRESYGNPFFMEAIRGINEFCNPRQIATTVITGSTEAELLETVRSQAGRVDGFIMLYAKQNDSVVEYLCERGLLYVVVGTPMQLQNQTIFIDNDNLQCAREATDRLYELGHRRIGFIGSDTAHHFARERKAGYQLSMLQHSLPIRPEHSLEIIDVVSGGTEPLEHMLRQPDRPTAIVAGEDILGIALTQVCSRLGLSIPEDLSVISFSNSILTLLASPALTCLDVNSFQLGYEAASQIMNHVENPNLMATKIIVPHCIIDRGSTKAMDNG